MDSENPTSLLTTSEKYRRQPNNNNYNKQQIPCTYNKININNTDNYLINKINCNSLKTKLNNNNYNITTSNKYNIINTKCSMEEKCSKFNYFYTNMLFYSNGFYKFLARFSGRRRQRCFQSNFTTYISNIACFLVIFSLFNVSEACSSRTIPKPRPSPTPTPRPNITFHTYKCPPNYAAWYCLNEATCFTVKIGDEILYNCECADGYMGPRCEYKELDGSYLPTRPRAMLETASIASGATLALIVVLLLCLTLYMRWQQRQKLTRLSASNADLGVDTVDGVVSSVIKCEHHGRRPFGPHHYETLPMTATLKR